MLSERATSPKIDWLNTRGAFFFLAVATLIEALVLVATYWVFRVSFLAVATETTWAPLYAQAFFANLRNFENAFLTALNTWFVASVAVILLDTTVRAVRTPRGATSEDGPSVAGSS